MHPFKLDRKVAYTQIDIADVFGFNHLKFHCKGCKQSFEISFRYMKQSGTEFSLDKLVSDYHVFTESEVIEKNLANKSTNPFYKFQIGNHPAIAKIDQCNSCDAVYLTIFSAGEQQPGRDAFFISGVWKTENSSPISF